MRQPPATGAVSAYLHGAHTALWRAMSEAGTLADLGIHDDLWDVLVEVERIQQRLPSSLRPAKPLCASVRRGGRV